MSLISFTQVADNTTATAAGVNTPLSTIYNDYNGNITDANVSASAAIAGSKIAVASLGFGATVQSQSNAGTAGGTMYYVNLGGIKLLWAASASIAVTTGGTAIIFTLPTSFFSTVKMVQLTSSTPSATGSIYIEADSYSTTTVNVKITPASNQNQTVQLLVIGT